MLSESQERMLIIIDPERLDDIAAVFNKWAVEFSTIGTVTDDGMLRVKEEGEVVAEVPAKALVDAPEYDREVREPEYLKDTRNFDMRKVDAPEDYNAALAALLASHTIASKEWIAQKVDEKLKDPLCVGIGNDAGVYHSRKEDKIIAATIDGNGLYCYLDPLAGGKIAVAEAARNLVCCGARPLGVTDGLNFGDPFNPEIYWQFANVVKGITEACKFFDIPVVSGNVSFNNENPQGAVYPTPVIGMVGIVDDIKNVTSADFKNEEDMIFLIGENREELGGSQYLNIVHDLRTGNAPALDLKMEMNVQQVVSEMISEGAVASAHDCSDGGLAVALAECCIMSGRGANITLDGDMRTDALLFGETQSRIVISISPDNREKIESLCRKHGVSCTLLGQVKGDALIINDYINSGIRELTDLYTRAIPEAVDAG